MYKRQVNRFNYGDGTGFFEHQLTDRQLPLSLRHVRSATALDLQYSYDGNNRITSIGDLKTPTRDRTFSYDEAGRLIRAETQDHLHGNIDYAYDALGNLRSKSYATGQYAGREIELTYSWKNRLHRSYDMTMKIDPVNRFSRNRNGITVSALHCI